MATLSDAGVAHQQKIHRAKQELEENEGKTIKRDKIQEWALLEICERLGGIHIALLQANIPKIGIGQK